MSKFLKGLTTIGALFMGIYLANEYVTSKATKNLDLENSKGEYFSWKGLNIFYKHSGSGTPVLLVHSCTPESSLREWKYITPLLAEKHTVYSIDLPGCGNSAKPSTEYNPYYFALLIEKFAEEVIGEKTALITSGSSSIAGVLASESPLIGRIFMIDPVSLEEAKETGDSRRDFLSRLLCLPILGTAYYNCIMSKQSLQNKYSSFFRDTFTPEYDSFINDCFETSHTGKCCGRYLLAGITDTSTVFDYSFSLKNISIPVCIAEGAYLDGLFEKADAFKELNPEIKTTFVKSSMAYPHIENAENTVEKILAFTDETPVEAEE